MASNRGASGDIIPKGYKAGQIQQYTPEQMQLYNQQYEHVGSQSYLSRLAGGDQSIFDEIEAPAWRDFQQSQGQLASRFSGQGLGGRQSSGFQNASGQLGNDFAMQLQANRHNLKRQAMNDLMGFSNQILGQQPYERFLTEKAPKQGVDWLGLGGAAIGGIAGGFAGGPMGAIAGASTGYNIGSGGKGGGNSNFGYANSNQNQMSTGGISSGSQINYDLLGGY